MGKSFGRATPHKKRAMLETPITPFGVGFFTIKSQIKLITGDRNKSPKITIIRTPIKNDGISAVFIVLTFYSRMKTKNHKLTIEETGVSNSCPSSSEMASEPGN